MDLFVAAAFASLILVALAQWAADRRGPGRRLARLFAASGIRVAVRRSLILLTVVPSVGLVVILTRLDIEREQDQIRSSTIAASKSASVLIDSFLTRHADSVTGAAESIAIDGNLGTEHLVRHLLGFHSVNRDFLTMLVADDKGAILAATGRDEAIGVRGLNSENRSVADRPYFVQTMSSRQRGVSDAFVGRGFGTDHIVAITAPLIIRGRLAGVVEGSLNLGAFERLDAQFSNIFGGELILLDSAGRVVYAPTSSGLSFLQSWSPPSDAVRAATDGPISANDFFIASSTTRDGWRAVVMRPKPSLATRLAAAYTGAAGWMVASLAGAILLSWALARRTATPISKLLEALRRYGRGETEQRAASATRMPKEYLTVFRHLHRVQRQQLRSRRALQEALETEKMLGAQLEAAVVRLEAADRAKNAFLATASHELRTPLNAIVGFSQLLEMQAVGPMNDEQMKQIGIVRTSGESLRALVADILDVTAIEGGHFTMTLERFNLIELIRNTLPPFAIEAKARGLTLSYSGPSADIEVVADPRRLDQILRNLISNAIKFTDAGSIEIGIAVRATDERRAEVFVRDSGIGIAPEHHSRLFKPFNRIEIPEDRRPGTGLGLAICKQLAEAMQCRIGFVSDPGFGSTFWVEVPLAG